MTKPQMLLSHGSGALPEERRLLSAGAALSPPPGAQAAIWAGLAARLPPSVAPAPETTGVSSTANGAGLTGLVKSGLVGVALGLGVAGGAKLALDDAPPAAALRPNAVAVTPAPPPAPAETQARTVAPDVPAAKFEIERNNARPRATTVAAPPTEVEDSEQVDMLPSVAGSAPPKDAEEAAAARTSQLREESLSLRRARSALHAGNAILALALLEEAQRAFPRPILGQEREALSIEALVKSGAMSAARQRAQAFVTRYPQSPHSDRLRRIAAPR